MVSRTNASLGRRATITDVARLAGVSIKTVSRVVNGVSTVNAELAARVQAAIAELGFQPNQLAAALKSGASTATIGLVIQDISNNIYSGLMIGVADVARRHGTQVITSVVSEFQSDDEELSVIYDLCKRRVEGLIVVPGSGDLSVLRQQIDGGTPMVFVDRQPHGLVADSIQVDNRGGAHAATRDLIAQGHRRFAVVLGSLTVDTMAERFAGVRDALREAGILVSQSTIITGVQNPADAATAVTRILETGTPPTAVICGNSRATIGAIEAVRGRPGQVAIAGFDTFPLAHLMPVPLTLVGYDANFMGRRAAELLFQRIGVSPQPPEHIVLSTTLERVGAQQY